MSDATNSLSSLVPLSWLSGDTTLGPSDTHYGPSGAPIQISQYEYDRLRSSNSLRYVIHQLIHPLQLWMLILSLLIDLEY